MGAMACTPSDVHVCCGAVAWRVDLPGAARIAGRIVPRSYRLNTLKSAKQLSPAYSLRTGRFSPGHEGQGSDGVLVNSLPLQKLTESVKRSNPMRHIGFFFLQTKTCFPTSKAFCICSNTGIRFCFEESLSECYLLLFLQISITCE